MIFVSIGTFKAPVSIAFDGSGSTGKATRSNVHSGRASAYCDFGEPMLFAEWRLERRGS